MEPQPSKTATQRRAAVEEYKANQKLKAALTDLFAMIDEGLLVRDISKDGEPDYAKRSLAFALRLAKAHEALKG